jgi:DNA-binding MarR family transcriptional regulator
VDDYLDYLLSHAAACFQSRFDAVLKRAGVTRDEWRILCTLGDHGAGLTARSIHEVTLQPQAAMKRTLAQMAGKGWLRRRGEPASFRLTRAGHGMLVPLLAAAKAHEADALSRFPDVDARRLKEMLKALMSSARPLQVRRHRSRHGAGAPRAACIV